MRGLRKNLGRPASLETGQPCGDALEFSATGASIADVDAHVWLDSLPLMRAIAVRLAKTG